jgi:hypothetical protein
MTTLTLRNSGHLPARASSATHVSKLSTFAERVIESWNRRKTERMLEGLPVDIRKDIGWPTSDQPRH